jgi:pyruvate formate lyase activating enzyme
MSTEGLGSALLVTARNAIAKRFGLTGFPVEPVAELAEPGATFVTLTQGGQLRGCIGSLEAYRPLAIDVAENALAAAFRDHRFAPLSQEEFPRTRVEVSLLTPAEPFPVTSEADALARLRPGIDGLVLSYGRRRATFLPQVWESLPDAAPVHGATQTQGGPAGRFLARGPDPRALRSKQMEREVNHQPKVPESAHPGRWWHAIEDERIQCDLCPRDCKLHAGQRGACFVRQNLDGQMVLTTYGRSSGFCIDPIEKKPLNHFFPGSAILSFGTAGCNLACKFCQNWDISKSKDMDRLLDAASPDGIAAAAVAYGAQSVAFTYNDPVIFAEYAIDTALACHERGIQTVAVTAGYIHAAPAREFFAVMDGANVDLKAFTDDFYFKLCGGHLQPVLDILAYIHHETKCWLEITTLLIPGKNDSASEIKALADWVARELGPEVPVHFTAFHPDWKMDDLPATPPSTLTQARRIALDAGLHYVYTGNVHDTEGGTTFCPGCQAALIERDWYNIRHYDLPSDGRCPHCGTTIAGHFARFGKPFGPRRVPVRLLRR